MTDFAGNLNLVCFFIDAIIGGVAAVFLGYGIYERYRDHD